MAELKVLTAKSVQEVTRAYRKALTASRRNTFFLQSSLSQLEMLEIARNAFGISSKLESRSSRRKCGACARRKRTKNKMSKRKTEKARATKRDGHVFLFTGYMINNPRKKREPLPA